MPKVNPFVQVAKRLASLQAKSTKLNEDLKTLAGFVEVEMRKQDATPAPTKAAPKSATKAAPGKAPKAIAAKAAPAKADKTVTAPKRGRPAKK